MIVRRAMVDTGMLGEFASNVRNCDAAAKDCPCAENCATLTLRRDIDDRGHAYGGNASGRANRSHPVYVRAGWARSYQAGTRCFRPGSPVQSCSRTFFEPLEFPFEMAKLDTPFADFTPYNALRAE
jgi:hypothetical protein